jgi:hypothetical protein
MIPQTHIARHRGEGTRKYTIIPAIESADEFFSHIERGDDYSETHIGNSE